MDLLLMIVGVMMIAYSFTPKGSESVESMGFIILCCGILMNVGSYIMPVVHTDEFAVTELDGIVFSEPTKIVEHYTEYPFSFRQDKVIYKVSK
jgi:hypothetical protein